MSMNPKVNAEQLANEWLKPINQNKEGHLTIVYLHLDSEVDE